jgi:hypothetical protein
LENELNQERAKFRQEYFTVEEEKKEMISLRARMDEYERGVYGLAEAMYASPLHNFMKLLFIYFFILVIKTITIENNPPILSTL